MEELKIKDEFIKLGQALKLSGIAASGIDAKIMIQEGEVKYNWVHSVLTNTPGVDDFEELLMNGGISNIKIKLDQYPSTKSVMVKEGS